MAASRLRLPIRHHGQMKSKWISTVTDWFLLTAVHGSAVANMSEKLTDQRVRLRPVAIAGCGVQVPDLAKVDETAAPVRCHAGSAIKRGKRVIVAGSENAWERQRFARARQPSMFFEHVQRRVT